MEWQATQIISIQDGKKNHLPITITFQEHQYTCGSLVHPPWLCALHWNPLTYLHTLLEPLINLQLAFFRTKRFCPYGTYGVYCTYGTYGTYGADGAYGTYGTYGTYSTYSTYSTLGTIGRGWPIAVVGEL